MSYKGKARKKNNPFMYVYVIMCVYMHECMIFNLYIIQYN